MRKKIFVLVSALIALTCACSKNNSDPVPPSPDGETVSFKAEFPQFDTKVTIEPSAGKGDTFKITGWEVGDKIICCHSKVGVDDKIVEFTYNDGEFTAILPEGLDMSDLGVCFYYDGTYISGEANVWKTKFDSQDVKVTAGTTNIARCPLVGFLHKKEGSESEYVATMKADYSLLCIHNNSGKDGFFVVTMKDKDGNVKYRQEIGSEFDINTMTSSVWQGTTEIIEEAQATEIKNGEKAYLIIPASQSSEEVCITSVIDGTPMVVSSYEPVSAFNPGKIYTMNVEKGENCHLVYLLEEPYTFKANMKGHSLERLGKWETAEVLWETIGTTEKPNVGDVISMTYNAEKEEITVTGHKNGNALVAVKDKDGNILWSWHIWVCKNYHPEVYVWKDQVNPYSQQLKDKNRGEGTIIMDRNLGATERYSAPDAAKMVGLLYQWGRKDPFMGVGSLTNDTNEENAVPAASTLASALADWPQVKPDAQTGTIDYTIKHPTTLLLEGPNQDWLYSQEIDKTRWAPEKTMYDPCPKGWHVPDHALWRKAFWLEGAKDRNVRISWLGAAPVADFSVLNHRDPGFRYITEDFMLYFPGSGYLRMEYDVNEKDPYKPHFFCLNDMGFIWTTYCEDAQWASEFWYSQLGAYAELEPTNTGKVNAHSVRCIMLPEYREKIKQ